MESGSFKRLRLCVDLITNMFITSRRFGGRSWVTIVGYYQIWKEISEPGIPTTTITHNGYG